MKILQPLRERDYALLFAGISISLIGDGMYLVAIAWAAFDLTHSASGLAWVGLGWTSSIALSALFAGIVSDRFERRRVMISADLLRAAAIGAIAALSLSHQLSIGVLVALVVVFAAGAPMFEPAMTALVPDILPPELLLDSSSLTQVSRQFMRLLIGPVIGGAVVASAGVGTAFAIDAGTFLASALAVFLIRTRSRAGQAGATSVLDDARAGYAYVRSQRWLIASVFVQGLQLLAYLGPTYVLLPYIIRHDLGGGASDFSLVLAADGVGSVIAGLLMSRFGMPKRYLTAMFAFWAIFGLPLIGFGIVHSVIGLMVMSGIFGVFVTAGIIILLTTRQSRVPAAMRGRVSSLDWLVGMGFAPLSLALTAPAAHLFGARATLIGAGALSSLVAVGLYVAFRLWDDEPPIDGVTDAAPPGAAADEAPARAEPAPTPSGV